MAGSMAYFLNREDKVVRANEYMSEGKVQPKFRQGHVLQEYCWLTFPVVAEGHLGLAQANGVLA